MSGLLAVGAVADLDFGASAPSLAARAAAVPFRRLLPTATGAPDRSSVKIIGMKDCKATH